MPRTQSQHLPHPGPESGLLSESLCPLCSAHSPLCPPSPPWPCLPGLLLQEGVGFLRGALSKSGALWPQRAGGASPRGADHLPGWADGPYSYLGGLRRGLRGWGLRGWWCRHKGCHHIQGSRGRHWFNPLRGGGWGWGPSARDRRYGLTWGDLGTGWGGLCLPGSVQAPVLSWRGWGRWTHSLD